jgi:hypothetical protein
VPTDLPGSKRKGPRRTQAATAQKPSVFSRLLNTFMVGTVLFLFAIVLLQEKRYADGEPGTVADAFMQKAQAAPGDSGAEGDPALGSN